MRALIQTKLPALLLSVICITVAAGSGICSTDSEIALPFDAWLEQQQGGQPLRTTAAFDSTELDSFIGAMMAQYHVPGLAACIVKRGEIVWTGSYGLAVIEQGIPVADTTLFYLASVSKTITGAALLQLWENGLFDLDDDINDYLPFQVVSPAYPDSIITFRHLFLHTSSISDNLFLLLSLTACGDSPIPLGEFLEDYLTPGGQYYDPDLNFNGTIPGST